MIIIHRVKKDCIELLELFGLTGQPINKRRKGWIEFIGQSWKARARKKLFVLLMETLLKLRNMYGINVYKKKERKREKAI